MLLNYGNYWLNACNKQLYKIQQYQFNTNKLLTARYMCWAASAEKRYHSFTENY